MYRVSRRRIVLGFLIIGGLVLSLGMVWYLHFALPPLAPSVTYTYVGNDSFAYEYYNATQLIDFIYGTGEFGGLQLTLSKEEEINITRYNHPMALLQVETAATTYNPFFTYHVIEYGEPLFTSLNRSLLEGWWFYWINLSLCSPAQTIRNIPLSQTSPPFLSFLTTLQILPCSLFNGSASTILNIPLEFQYFPSEYSLLSNALFTTPDNLTIGRGLQFTYNDLGILQRLNFGYSLEYQTQSFYYSITMRLVNSSTQTSDLDQEDKEWGLIPPNVLFGGAFLGAIVTIIFLQIRRRKNRI